MLNLVLPKVESEATSQQFGKFPIGPLERGYGVTIGNALRRVLLSSLPGAAVTSIRIDGVYHEFSPIPHCKEDTTTLILRIKQLRLKYDADEPVRLYLRAKGPGKVTAASLECPPGVEIVNPDLHLLTLDSDEAEVDMELVVQRGRGYSPAEERGKLPIGEIPVDAIFSPVRKVKFAVDRARIGQMTNFDKLLMEIWTDGTITPTEALSMAAQYLVRHFALIAEFGGIAVEEEEVVEEEEEEGIPIEIYNVPIEELDLSVRAFNCLKRAGITRVGEILERLQKGKEEMLAIRNFGEKSLAELEERLQAKGFLRWAEEEEMEESEEEEGLEEEGEEETAAEFE